MKRNTHLIVPASAFKLLKGDKALSTYKFGTKTAKHTFCKVCGVCSFYMPRSNPGGIAVTVACIEGATITSIKVNKFDGQNWEDAYAATNIGALTGECGGGGDSSEEDEEDGEEDGSEELSSSEEGSGKEGEEDSDDDANEAGSRRSAETCIRGRKSVGKSRSKVRRWNREHA